MLTKMFWLKLIGILWTNCLLEHTVWAQQLQIKQLHTLHKWTDLTLNVDKTENNHNFLPVDIDIEYGDEGPHRTFLTIPRLSAATPFTLATVMNSDNKVIENPRLEAYPSMSWHVPSKNCSGITSAIRTYIDECWRLWVMDSGQVNTFQLCAPQVFIFDLVKDELVQRSYISAHMYTPGISIFTAMTVDLAESVASSKCMGGKAYIADAWGYGLIVFDALTGKSWRIEHESMQPNMEVRRFGSAFAGIFTVSLSPAIEIDRMLYFHTLNSFLEIAIPLKLVNNASYWQNTSNVEVNQHVRIIGTRGMQCESEVMDNEGNLYCSLISLGALISWHEYSSYTADDIRAVAYNPQQLKFVTGLKINRNSKGENELWALSSDPKLFVGGLTKRDEVRFQIIGCRTVDLLANTPCTVGVMSKSSTQT